VNAPGARRALLESAAVLAGALLAVAALVWLDGPAPDLRGDQKAINLMVVKTLHPDWFVGDPLYGRDPSRFYTPAFLGLQTAIARRLDGDPTRALQILLWPVGVLFLAGHYALFRAVTGSPWAAALGALASATTRNALGGEYWGFAGLESVQPRVIVLGAAPLLVLAFLRWRGTPWLPAFFLLTGAGANVHPIGGLHLCQIAIVTHLVLERARPRAWLDVTRGGALFVLGASPFVMTYLTGRENVSDPALFSVLRAAVQYRFDYLLLPQRLDALVSVAFHSLLPAAAVAWLAWRRGWPRDLATLAVFGATALVLGIAGTAAIQALAVGLDRPYVDIQQLRAAKYLYVLLLAGLAAAFARLLARRTVAAGVAAGALLILALVPPGALIHSFSEERREAVKRLLGMTVAARAPAPADAVEVNAAARQVERWLDAHAARNDLVFTDDDAIRITTRRPITGTFKDGAYVILAGTAPFARWYLHAREVEGCRARRGTDCWFTLAARVGAVWVVVDPGVGEAKPATGFEQVWSRSGWSLWRRS